MSLASDIVWEVRTTGADTNGGGFKASASGTDWTQQDSPQYSVTDAVTAGTTTITSATANFGTDVVGNVLYIQGGTGSITAGWYEIVSRTNSTTIVVDRSTGLSAGTGATLKIGGALATLNKLAALLTTSGNDAYVKATADYTTSTTITFSGYITTIRGYTTTRGDNGQFTVKATAGSITIIQCLNSGCSVLNAIADANSQSSIIGFENGGNSANAAVFDNCKAVSCQYGFSLSGSSKPGGAGAVNCVADSCTSVGFAVQNGIALYNCWAKSCTTGIDNLGAASGPVVDRCLITGGTTGVRVGASGNVCSFVAINSVFYGQSGDGLRITTNTIAAQDLVVNNIFYSIGGYGINAATPNGSVASTYTAGGRNAFGACTSGQRNLFPAGPSDITLSADPFTNAGTNDFSLNNTAGGGAACRAAGFPGTIAGGLTTGYLDVGLAQHQDSGGSAGMLFVPNLDGV